VTSLGWLSFSCNHEGIIWVHMTCFESKWRLTKKLEKHYSIEMGELYTLFWRQLTNDTNVPYRIPDMKRD
jgi:hypothetical protein